VAGGAAQLALAGAGDVGAVGVEGLDGLISGVNRLGETDLVILRQQGVSTDVSQRETNEVFVIAIKATNRHRGQTAPFPVAE